MLGAFWRVKLRVFEWGRIAWALDCGDAKVEAALRGSDACELG